MFFACDSAIMVKNEHVGFIDSGCSNHLISHELLLINVNMPVNTMIKMGNGQIVQAIWKVTLLIMTKNGIRYIKEVMLVPDLYEKLLSVGQMISYIYLLLFGDKLAIFEDRQFEYHVATMQMTENICFLLLMEDMNSVVRKDVIHENAWDWHIEMGHLKFQHLQLLEKKEIVNRLPRLKGNGGVCAGCAARKQHVEVFSK